MAAALQSAAIPGQRAAEVAVDRQRTGAAAAALFGAVNAIAWIAYFVSHAYVKPAVVGKLPQTYDFLHATAPSLGHGGESRFWGAARRGAS